MEWFLIKNKIIKINLSSGRILACSPSLENELKNELDKVSPFKKNLYT